MSLFSSPSDSTRRALIHIIFLFSGASALAYEIVWTRQLTLIAGATTPAVSIVLAVFMGGLAIGAWLLGSVADRTTHLLKWYAGLELGIGFFALVQPHLMPGMGRLYLAILPNLGEQGASLMGLRVGFSALLLLVPTVLMGGTLPILVRYVSRQEGTFGRDMGRLYALNLGGAVLGSALTGFFLIRYLGLQGTITVAVLTSFGAGLAAYILSTLPAAGGVTDRDEIPQFPASGAPQSMPPRLSLLLWCVVGFSGFLTMAYEVAWTRMLIFSFGSTTYSFTLILVVFLLGLTLGSMLFVRFEKRIDGASTLAVCHVLGAGSALLLAPIAANLLVWIHQASERLGFTGGVQLAGTMLGSIAVMLLPTMVMGIIFPLASRMLIQRLDTSGRRLGRAYWVNTAGSILGALLTGFLLIPGLSIKGSLLALAGIQTALGLLLLPWSRFSPRVRILGAALSVGAMALVAVIYLRLLPGPSPFDQLGLAETSVPVVEAHRDDATASVTVVRTASGDRMLRINGFVATEDSARAGYMPMMSHLPLLLLGQPKPRVLVICFGTGATAGAAALHPGAQVDVVEINPAVLALAPWFEEANHGVYKDSRAKLIVDDGRNYLASTDARYDVITSEPMPPTHAGVVNLYSREYYVLARERLEAGGLMVQWLPFHLVSYLEAKSILRTVQDVFPETTLWLHSNTGLIVARKEAPVGLPWSSATRAYDVPGLARDLDSLMVPSPRELAQLYTLGPEALRVLAGKAPIITDDRPSLEFHPPRHRASVKYGPYTEDSAKLMQEVFALRGGEEAPLSDCPPDEAARVSSGRRVRTATLIGSLLMHLGHPVVAEEAYLEGLRLATTAADRAVCLFHLALAAEAKGDLGAALGYAEHCLAEAPAGLPAAKLVARLRAAG